MKATIGLDAGHGGSSSGTYSCNSTKDGLFEKDYALELVLLINERLLANGFKTVLSRTTDCNPGTVSQRAQKFVNAKCNYAVSVHFNGFDSQSANGAEVFVPYGEQGAGIEAGFHKVLGEFFKLRAPFAKSSHINNRNNIFDKKLNVATRKFEVWCASSDYFGFIRTAWAGGLSADLLEVCFLTNPQDFATYTANKEAIADGIARSIVEGYGEEYAYVQEEQEKQKEDVKPSVTAKPRIGRVLRRNRVEMVK